MHGWKLYIRQNSTADQWGEDGLSNKLNWDDLYQYGKKENILTYSRYKNQFKI